MRLLNLCSSRKYRSSNLFSTEVSCERKSHVPATEITNTTLTSINPKDSVHLSLTSVYPCFWNNIYILISTTKKHVIFEKNQIDYCRVPEVVTSQFIRSYSPSQRKLLNSLIWKGIQDFKMLFMLVLGCVSHSILWRMRARAYYMSIAISEKREKKRERRL